MEDKMVQMSFRVFDSVAREFKALCAMNGTSQQAVLEHAVKNYIEKKKKSE